MKITSMIDFVLEQAELVKKDKLSVFDFALKVKKIATFLKPKITVGMFIPCDLEGNILNNPFYKDYRDKEGGNQELYLFNKKTYKEAKERVLFKGF